MTHNEFFFIYDTKFTSQNVTFLDIKESFEHKNVKQLNIIKDEFNVMYLQNSNIQDYHSYLVCSVLIKRLNNQNNTDYELTVIKNYLLNVNEWSHYEISLLNNTMFIFDYETLNNIVGWMIKKMGKENSFQKDSDELVKIISNILIMKILNKEYDNINYLIEYITNYQTKDTETKIFIYFWQKMYNYLNNTKTSNDDIKNIISWLDDLDIKHLSILFYNIFNNI